MTLPFAPAPVAQSFCPLITQRSPSRRAVVRIAPASEPARTLEDSVADMLRPMLQRWVDDNMPRIIEKALRVEVARAAKPGPSSSSDT